MIGKSKRRRADRGKNLHIATKRRIEVGHNDDMLTRWFLS
jgi:hypothetical protein